MTTEDAGGLDPSDDSAAEIARLEHEIQRDGLASQSESDAMVGAVTGLIEERRAELERSPHPS